MVSRTAAMPYLRLRTGFPVIRHPANRSVIQTQTVFPGILDLENLHTLAPLM